MEILGSPWFFSMVEKRAANPQAKLLTIFTVVGEWMLAPGIREQFSANTVSSIPASPGYLRLTAFLTKHAQAANASNPAALSQQLSLLLIGAIAEQLRTPELPVMEDAANAAEVLVRKACTYRSGRKMAWLGGIAATLVVSATAWMLLPHHATTPAFSVAYPTSHGYQTAAYPLAKPAARQLSPDEIEAVLTLHEQIVSGECRAPHMAMLPPGQTEAYMNVVESRQPSDPEADRAALRAFMTWFNTIHATECFPKHENDHINTAWVKRKIS